MLAYVCGRAAAWAGMNLLIS